MQTVEIMRDLSVARHLQGYRVAPGEPARARVPEPPQHLRARSGKGMRNDTDLTDPGHQYAAAHAAHYETKDLREALELYKGILATHPDTREAGYSRSQILNIVKEVAPERKIFEALVGVARVHFGGDRQQEMRISGAPETEATT